MSINIGIERTKEHEEMMIRQVAWSNLKHMPGYAYDCTYESVLRENGIRKL